MQSKRFLFTTTVLALGAIPVSATAQTSVAAAAQSQADLPANSENADAAADEIIVKGIRGSIESAANKKRNSKQIVDSVVAEDVGKLPDNNVVEAISRLPGVQITRERGQGQTVAIRGLAGVQTTVNGNNTNLGDGRSLDLSDIPAELLKSVDVYKTRTADQVEGSIAGTVNVELRRPLDFKNGLTVAGSLKGVYDDLSEKISPSASLLIAKRFDTGAGEFGILVNGALSRTKYFENYIESESPDVPCCSDFETGEIFPGTPRAALPPGFEDTVIPYRAQYGLEEGYTDLRSVNVALQWSPSANLSLVLEGGYIGTREKRSSEKLYVIAREFGTEFSDIVLQPDGRTVRSMTISSENGLPAGVDSIYNSLRSNLYTTNLEARWTTGDLQVDAKAQYNWSNEGYYFVEHLTRPADGRVNSVFVDFASDQYKGGVPSFQFGDWNLDDVSDYGLDRFQDNVGGSKNRELALQLDTTYTISADHLLRSIQVGGRYNRRVTSRYYGFRDGFPWVNGALPPLSDFPGGGSASQVSLSIGGVDSPSWFRIPGATVLQNIGNTLNYIQETDPPRAEIFSTALPPSDNGQTFRSIERNAALYAQVNYGFDIGVPVDGTLGVRYTRTWGRSTSFNFKLIEFADGGCCDVVESTAEGKGKYEDFLPSATATIHFSPKTQLRLSYTTNVQRPSFYDARPFFFAVTIENPPVIFAGNPALKAQREQSFDISAEHYFGRGGQISLAAYHKTATGFLFYSREEVSDLQEYGLPGQNGFVEQLRNAGDGTFTGVEGTIQSFFDFAPGFLGNFGASLNASYLLKARVEFPFPESFPGAYDSTDTSKWTVNSAIFYDTPKFSARLAFNYRSPFRYFIWEPNPEYSFFNDSTYRVDAAINYTPVEFVTFSLEGGNLLGHDVYRYFGKEKLLPLGVRTLARTVQGSVRFRF